MIATRNVILGTYMWSAPDLDNQIRDKTIWYYLYTNSYRSRQMTRGFLRKKFSGPRLVVTVLGYHQRSVSAKFPSRISNSNWRSPSTRLFFCVSFNANGGHNYFKHGVLVQIYIILWLQCLLSRYSIEWQSSTAEANIKLFVFFIWHRIG